VGATVLTNLAMTSLPLSISEPIMTALDPQLAKRQRVPGYKAEDFVGSSWSIEEARKKSAALKEARGGQAPSSSNPVATGALPLKSLLRVIAQKPARPAEPVEAAEPVEQVPRKASA